ncbi:MAG: CHAT domain-containing protein [Gemmatimonadota bacterium]
MSDDTPADERLATHQEAVDLLRQLGHTSHPAYTVALLLLAEENARCGHSAIAEAQSRIALAIRAHIGGGDDRHTALATTRLAMTGRPAAESDAMASFMNLPGEHLTHLYQYAKLSLASEMSEWATALLFELLYHSRNDAAHARLHVQVSLELAQIGIRGGVAAARHGMPAEAIFESAEGLIDEALDAHRKAGGAAALERALGDRGENAPDRYLERAAVLRAELAGARGHREDSYEAHRVASGLRARWRTATSPFEGYAVHNVSMCIATGRWQEASAALEEWSTADDEQLDRVLGGETEERLMEYLNHYRILTLIAISGAARHDATAQFRVHAMNMVLRRKMIVADALRMRQALRTTPGQSDTLDGDTPDTAGFGLRGVDCGRVARALQPGQALVEIVRAPIADFTATPAQRSFWSAARYLAFVLQPDRAADILVMDIGDAREIEMAIWEWLRHMPGMLDNDGRLDGTADQDLLDALNPDTNLGLLSVTYSGVALRQLLVDPILERVGPVDKLIVAPDGLMCAVPLGALPDVVDTCVIQYLSSGRDILRSYDPDVPRNPPVVMANPEYGLPEDVRGNVADLREDWRVPFEPLPATHEEGLALSHMLQVPLWFGNNATKARVMAPPAPRILHIATHGYYRPLDDPRSATPFELLRRCGLALAGANCTSFDEPSRDDDGLLTAEDVTRLDLRGTALVVLSACETGLGAIRADEGVFGLRRAFIIAGARALVVSLWSVPDSETRDLMLSFYEHLTRGMGAATALSVAQQEMRRKKEHPYFWAAFICIGDDTPLDDWGIACRS